MIKYNPKNWARMIFAIDKSDTLRILWKEMIYIALFSLGLAYVVLTYGEDDHVALLEKLTVVYSLIGFVISLLLVFRTNTAYERWWEGRKKWGCLVNDSRNLSIKIAAITNSKEHKDFFKRMIPNFLFATKEHLRDQEDLGLMNLTDEEMDYIKHKAHKPNAVVQLIYQQVNSLKKEGVLSEEEYIVLDKNMNALLDSLGACERIKNTPIPYSYMLFLKKFIIIYVTTLPLAFVGVFGYYAALISTFVFYVLVSMEVLAEEIEDPFGTDDNDLPTDTISEKIKQNVTEILGD